MRSFSGTISADFIFPLNGPCFPVSLQALWFYVENRTFECTNVVTLEIRSSFFPLVNSYCYCCCLFWFLKNYCCRLGLCQDVNLRSSQCASLLNHQGVVSARGEGAATNAGNCNNNGCPLLWSKAPHLCDQRQQPKIRARSRYLQDRVLFTHPGSHNLCRSCSGNICTATTWLRWGW